MNLSGIGVNKVFKTGIEPAKPYYYVSGSLDLAGAVYGGTYFFNFDDSLKYASTRDYANFIMVDENAVISEVLVYSGPDLVGTGNQQGLYFAIGGADYKEASPDNEVKVWWAAPAGFGPFNYPPVGTGPYYNGYPLTADEIAEGPVNYFGHEGGHFPYDKKYNNTGVLINDTNKRYKFLAVTILSALPSYPTVIAPGVESKEDASNEEVIILEEPKDDVVVPQSSRSAARIVRERKRSYRSGLPTGEKAVESGRLTVVLKVYPKSQ